MSGVVSNQTYGRLTTIECVGTSRDRHKIWRCRCICGNEKLVSSRDLKSGNTKSCGCLVKEQKTRYSHGKHGTRLYRIWQTMKARCKYATHVDADYYCDKGITVCDEWANSFEAFEKWADKNGYKDNLTIDRINCNGNYEPNNCRWATPKVQCNNKGNNRVLTINGEQKTVTQWSEISGVNRYTIYKRLNRGVRPYDAVFSKPYTIRGDI